MLNFDAIVKPVGQPAPMSTLAQTKAVIINGEHTEIIALVRQDLQALNKAPRPIKKYIAARSQSEHDRRPD